MDRMQVFSSQELTLIHHASMQVLDKTGVDFNDQVSAGLFKKHGFRTRGTVVYFTEKQIQKALESTVSQFKIHARNPVHDVTIGEDRFAILPTGGAPAIAERDGTQRQATLQDFKNCCKLVQTSDQVDLGGYLMVQPGDIPAETSHLDMMHTYMTHCNKPMLGASSCGMAAMDTIEMAGILFGDKEKLKDNKRMVSVVNAASPLQFSCEQSEVIRVMSEYRQPFVIANMILAGASGPVSLPSLLVLQNAEILAGIALSQIISPGAPVIYGSTSAPMDMKTMVSAVGASETVKIANATIQLARFYNLPSRCGGSLTDAHIPDTQALSEGTLMLSTVVRNGVNCVYHACGQMGSYISMSFEKWMLDEEVCRTVRQMILPLVISEETLDVEMIHDIGIGGQYLTHPKTFQHFRELSQPCLYNRKDYTKWKSGDQNDLLELAALQVQQRLEAYQKPDMDPGIEQEMTSFVSRRKIEISGNCHDSVSRHVNP